jgi:C4-dicarboxylate-binding protein DctP
MANKAFLKSMGPELEAMVREEAFNAQKKVEKFAIEDVDRTVDVWKKNGGENIVLPEAETKLYLDQVKSVLPGLLGANAVIKADFDALSAAAQRVNK